MLSDLLQSVRAVRRSPMTAIAAVCTLALAFAVNTAVFSVVDKVLVRPLPIADSDRVVVMWPRDPANAATIGEVSYATFRSWETAAPAFDRLAAIGSVNWGLVLREGEPATVPVAAVSAGFFPLLGSTPLMGRSLRPEDDQRNSSRVAVISYGSWQRRFGGDHAIVGRPLRFGDHVYTVVGVMPDGFDYPRGAEFWVPLVPQLADSGAEWKVDILGDPSWGVLFVLGRLAPGVTIEAASADVSALIARDAGTGFRKGMEASLTPLDEHIFGATRPALLALAACAALVLLIGAVNVAVLLMVRASGRAAETATRLAIGATRWRIVRQSLADGLVLAALAGAIGLLLGYWAAEVLVAMAPANVPRLDAVRFDGVTVVFTGAIGLLTALLVGVAPGWQASRSVGHELSRGGARIGRSTRTRRTFVTAQVALALVLLVCAGLVGRSFINLLRVDLGFTPGNVLTMDVTWNGASPERHSAFYQALIERVESLSGVESAGAIYQRPLEHSGIGMDAVIVLEGQRVGPEFRSWEQNPTVNYETVTAGYFAAMGMEIVGGRGFTDADHEDAPRVAVLSEGLARRLWPGQDPIGKRLLPPATTFDASGAPRWTTVAGIVRDARYRGLTDPRFDLYVPYRQNLGVRVKHLMVRTSGDPLALAGPIRAEARRLAPAAIVEGVTTMDGVVRRQTGSWRFSASTLGILGFVALGLAALGVYATVSQSVVERNHEIGVRVAVGALPRQIAHLVLREGLVLTAAGIAAGLGIASAVTRWLTGLLFELRAVDPLTFGAVAALFALIALSATALPAWRAARVDPVLALKRP